MENKRIEVFQTDSDIVKQAFKKNNYLIEEDETKPKEYCAVYFSSNFIYYPNDTETFTKSVLIKDRYEWSNMKLEYAHKHIFIRDIKKQWYLDGINENLNTPKKLLEFLRKETKSYKTIFIGSSAGGYAAVLYGQLLKSQLIYCFNGQFEISSLLKVSSENIDPLIFRNRNNNFLTPYYDLMNFIKNPETIYYFVSEKSDWDHSQLEHIEKVELNYIKFSTSHHGVPFPKIAINKLFSMPQSALKNLVNKSHNPIYFSIKHAGFFNTVTFLINAGFNKYLIRN